MPSTAEQQEAEQTRRNWLDRLFDNLVPRGIGGLFNFAFMGAIFVGIAYLVMRIEPVRNFIQERFPNIAAGLEGLADRMGGLGGFMDGATENYLMGLEGDAAQRLLVDKDVPAEMASILAADTETWRGFLNLVKDANRKPDGQPGTVSEATLLNDRTLFALLTQRREMAQQLIRALPRPAPGAAPNATTARVLTAVRSMIAVPGQLETLLNNDNIALTMEAVSRFSPLAITPEALTQFVRTVGMRNGAPTEGFRSFLTAALGDGAAFQQAFMTYVLSPEVLDNPGALAALARGITPPTGNGADDKTLRDMLQLLTYNSEPLSVMLKGLGPEKAQQFLALLQAGDAAAIANFAMQPEHIGHFKTFADTADRGHLPAGQIASTVTALHEASRAELATLGRARSNGLELTPEMMQISATSGPADLVNLLLDPTARRQWYRNENGVVTNHLGTLGDLMRSRAENTQDAGTRRLLGFLSYTPPSRGHYVNIVAVNNLAAALSSNPDNQTEEGRARAERVIGGLMGVLADPKHAGNALKDVTAADIRNFFRDDRNHHAFNNFLNAIDPNGFPAGSPERAMVTALRGNFGNGGSGISAVLRDTGGAQNLLDSLRNPGRKFRVLGIAVDFDIRTAPDWQLRAAEAAGQLDDSVRNNIGAVRNVMAAMDVAPARTPPRDGGQRSAAH